MESKRKAAAGTDFKKTSESSGSGVTVKAPPQCQYCGAVARKVDSAFCNDCGAPFKAKAKDEMSATEEPAKKVVATAAPAVVVVESKTVDVPEVEAKPVVTALVVEAKTEEVAPVVVKVTAHIERKKERES